MQTCKEILLPDYLCVQQIELQKYSPLDHALEVELSIDLILSCDHEKVYICKGETVNKD